MKSLFLSKLRSYVLLTRGLCIPLLAIFYALSGCKTPEAVEIRTTDTLIVVQRDTTERIVKERETIVKRDSSSTKIILSPDGRDTLKYYEVHYVENSSDRATIDSLRKALDLMSYECRGSSETRVIVKEVERQLKWWEKFLGWSGVIALAAVLLYTLYILYTRTRARYAGYKLVQFIHKITKL